MPSPGTAYAGPRGSVSCSTSSSALSGSVPVRAGFSRQRIQNYVRFKMGKRKLRPFFRREGRMNGMQSMWLWRTVRIVLTLTAGFLLTGMCAAQDQRSQEQANDLLDQVRRQEQVAAQKIEAGFPEALDDAERLSATSPARALERFKKIQAALEEDTLLPQSRQDAWKRLIKQRIRSLEDAKFNPHGKEKGTPSNSARRVEEDRRAAQTEKVRIRKALETIKNLQGEGKTAEASREASDLAGQQPQNNALQATERSAQVLDQVANERRLKKERERNLLGAYRDIERSSTLPGGDVEFPKDWKDRTKNRSTAIKLTVKEKAILRSLASDLTVNFKNTAFGDVQDYLKTRLDLNIIIDPDALKDAEISTDTPITLSLKNVSARTMLRKLFADLGLTYVLKDELIYVVSAQKARDLMVVRGYYVADLLAGMGTLSTALPQLSAPPTNPIQPLNPLALQAANPSPLQAAMQTVQNANALVELIKTSVDSSSWRDNGGAGTVTFHAPSLSLIIKQSAEVHALLGNGGMPYSL